MYPVTEDFNVYALIGYGVVKSEATDGDAPAPAYRVGETIVDEGSFQWGLGLNYQFNEHWTIFADYTRLLNEESIPPKPLYADDVPAGRTWDKISVDRVNVGVIYRF
jgi:opacity protein-like surface antigen